MIDWYAEAFRLPIRDGREPHRCCFLDSPGGRRIQLVESPAGRNLHVYVDGVKYEPAP